MHLSQNKEENVEKQTLRERFHAKGYSVTIYANAHGLCRNALRNVLDGYTNGKKRGKSRDCIDRLRMDGVWDDAQDGKQLTYDPAKRSA
ncbi:MAG: hypothetical protein JXK05_03895 [Campylobacterales bacterium]|nr:hypothetical protein [Campylobacterales bacterium]